MELFSVVKSGFFDSLNPCNVSTAVIFAGYLALLRKYQCNVSLLGRIFIILSWAYSLVALYGYFMPVLYSDNFFQFSRLFYCIVGLLFVLVGSFVFKSWIVMLTNKSHSGWVLHDTGKRGKVFFLLPWISVVFGAVFLNAMASIWPMDRDVRLLSYDLWDPQKLGVTIFLLLGVYTFMMLLPFVLASFWIPVSSADGWVAKNQTKAKSIVSAVLIGIGFGLVYVFH